MSAKQIDVRCPCCDTVLTVDVLTSKVLRSSAATEVDEFGKPKLNEGGWDAALDKIKGRGATGGSAFDAALERERNRESDLDDLFRKAREKADTDDES